MSAELTAQLSALQARLHDAHAENMRLTDALAEAKREASVHECAAVAMGDQGKSILTAIGNWLDLTAHNIEALRAELGLNEGRVKH